MLFIGTPETWDRHSQGVIWKGCVFGNCVRRLTYCLAAYLCADQIRRACKAVILLYTSVQHLDSLVKSVSSGTLQVLPRLSTLASF